MQIYIARNNNKYGPFTLEVIQSQLSSGKLIGSDLAWYEGAPAWIPLAQVPGLKISQGPPPLPLAQPQSPINPKSTPYSEPKNEVGCLPALGAVLLFGILYLIFSFFLGIFMTLLFGDAAFPICFLIGLIIVIGTSVWVFKDAQAIGVKKGQISGVADAGPGGYLLGCLLFWIIVFPVYLLARPAFKRINQSKLS